MAVPSATYQLFTSILVQVLVTPMAELRTYSAPASLFLTSIDLQIHADRDGKRLGNQEDTSLILSVVYMG